MNEIIRAYEEALTVNGLADNTVKAYKAMLRSWFDWSTTYTANPKEPTATYARKWAETLVPNVATIAQARAAIDHYCRLQSLPLVGQAIPRPREPRRVNRALSPRDARTLAATARGSGLAGTAVLIGLYTAARRSEIASLSWPNVDLDGRKVTLTRQKTRDRHTVPLHPSLHDHLAERHIDGATWVLPGRHGGHVSPATVWTWVLEIADDAGVGHVTPHQLRHTALTEAYDATKDIRAVQDLAGHKSPTITAVYTRTTEQAMRNAVEAITY